MYQEQLGLDLKEQNFFLRVQLYMFLQMNERVLFLFLYLKTFYEFLHINYDIIFNFELHLLYDHFLLN